MGGRKSLTVYEGMTGMMENAFINIKNRSQHDHRRGRDPDGRRQRRDHRAGRPLRRLDALHEGRQAGVHLQLPRACRATRSPRRGAARGQSDGRRSTSPTTAAAPGKGGKATLSVNGKKVAEGRIEKTQPNIFSADETADVGIDNQTPVAEGIGIGPETRFTGKINKVILEVSK